MGERELHWPFDLQTTVDFSVLVIRDIQLSPMIAVIRPITPVKYKYIS